MKNDFPNYLRDMDHDGDIDSHDFVLFHEMLDEDQEKEQRNYTQPYYGGSDSWTIYHSIAKGLLLLLFGGYLTLLFKGVFPINSFTAVLALFSAGCFFRALFL